MWNIWVLDQYSLYRVLVQLYWARTYPTDLIQEGRLKPVFCFVFQQHNLFRFTLSWYAGIQVYCWTRSPTQYTQHAYTHTAQLTDPVKHPLSPISNASAPYPERHTCTVSLSHTHTVLVKITIWTCERALAYNTEVLFSTQTACHRNLACRYRHCLDEHVWNILQSFHGSRKVYIKSQLQLQWVQQSECTTKTCFYFTMYKCFTVVDPNLILLQQ